MSKKRQAAGLTLVGASAGSGKTHQLTEKVLASMRPEAESRVDVAGLVAVTYTRRAAAELDGRIRRSLVQSSAHDEALRLPLAYVGTLHAVCLRLLQEYALDAGLSPQVDVMTGSELRLLREALERGLEAELRRSVQELGSRLQIRLNQRTNQPDWITPVSDIMTLARSNRIAPSELPAMAERAISGLEGLLAAPEKDGATLDAELLSAVQKTERALSKIDDGVKKTRETHRALERVIPRAKRGELRWSDWVKLQKLEPAKRILPMMDELREVAARVDRHPRLHQELRDYTLASYRAAQQGLEAYADWKRRRRVVDFVDMIDNALTLVEDAEVAAELKARLQLLTVDEFQDTSPVQLALFVRLHQLTGQSAWVGDPKQCIFEYAGADPALMDAVAEWARSKGGSEHQLPDNWRSRPALVEFTSQLFAAALQSHGYAPDSVVTRPVRETPSEMRELPALGLWRLESSKQDHDAHAIAGGIARLLGDPDSTPVWDRATASVRSLEAGDIAVLVATNAEATKLATTLALRGIRSAVARQGLLATPEGTFVDAALRCLLDERDSLHAALLGALTGSAGSDPDTWLEEKIGACDAHPSARESGADVPGERVPWFAAPLAALRTSAATRSPAEILDEVIAALDLEQLCARWPDPRQRLSNLDALRALVNEYEEHCKHDREAATVAGLLRYFDEARKPRLMRDEEIASDDQHVAAGRHAVNICTYHRAKGLEWPVVILSSLDRKERRDAFDVSPMSDRDAFDADDPLGGRWIRYWPSPFGAQRKTRLADRVAASPEGQDVAEREHRERARLLYVGCTRARDHLIFAAQGRKRRLCTGWLDDLHDGDGPLLTLPLEVSPTEIASIELRGLNGVQKVAARHWSCEKEYGLDPRRRTAELHARPTRAVGVDKPRLGYAVAPSRGQADWPELPTLKVKELSRIGKRLPLGDSKGVDWDVVGDVVHGFLAADVPDQERRLSRARNLLEAAQLTAVLAPEALVLAGDQLRAWVEARFPDAVWHREVPVAAVIDSPDGNRSVHGVVDLLLETDAGLVVVDHKSFPGGYSVWPKKAEELSPQLAAYATMLTMAGKKVVEAWLHFPLGGGVVLVG